ncbi:MAG: hypothetical protein ACX931_01985 [Saccharospirillum sp.]
MKPVMALLIAASVSACAAANTTEAFFGLAYELDSNRLLYREEHRLALEDGFPVNGEVRYLDADDAPLGTKTVTYREPARPGYTFEFNGLDRDTERVAPSDDGVRVDSVRDGELAWPSGQAVIDSGFHYFILNNFTALLDGESISFEFLAPTRVSWTSLTIEPQSNQNDRLVLTLKPRNRLIALFFDPIRLTYEVSTQRLLEYRGLTNVPKPGGGNYTARIEYRYDQEVK